MLKGKPSCRFMSHFASEASFEFALALIAVKSYQKKDVHNLLKTMRIVAEQTQ